MPKPLMWSQGTVLNHINASRAALRDDTPSLESIFLGKRVMSTLPLFHGAGLGQTWLFAIPFRNIIIAPAAVAIVTAEGLVEALKQTPADTALLAPSVVAELAQNPELLDFCAKHLDMIIYLGGDLPKQIGDKVAAVIPLRSQWGASEVGLPPQVLTPELDPKTDWRYVRFHTSTGLIMDPVGEGLYELVLRKDPALADTQTTFTIPGKKDLDEYRTKDLFAPHPTIPNEWAWKARADDIIVFLNGEKTNPILMEQHVVASNPSTLIGAIVVGAQRFQAGLIIEPAHATVTTAEQAALIESVWPSIEEANRVAPAHARVEKSLVLVTSPDRPLLRAGKGTLQRGISIAQYSREIDAMYAGMETGVVFEGEDDETELAGGSVSEDAAAWYIHRAVLEVTRWPILEKGDFFFEMGMDSLQALSLLRIVRRAFRRPDIGLSTIYQHSTVSGLARILVSDRNKALDENNDGNKEEMQSLLTTYRQLIHEIPVPPNRWTTETSETIDVILTGSTGTLGSMILRALLNRDGIGHIFCFNRRPIPLGQEPADVPVSRVTFLQVDLAKPDLGLSKDNYKTVRHRVGLIIHSAWPVNFNLSLSTFRPQLAGMVNLFALALLSAHRPPVQFISSIGAVAGSSFTGAAPERIIESLDAAHKNGYAQSKLIAELLCEEAASHLGLSVSIARVGQIAGPSTSEGQSISSWSRAEWLPSLVISSLHMGCIPKDLGSRFSEIDWTPSDLTAEVLVDLGLAEVGLHGRGVTVFNLRNPMTTKWQAMIPIIQSLSHELFKKHLDVVPPSTWLQRLEGTARRDSGYAEQDMTKDVAQSPAIRLLEFYRDGVWGNVPPAETMAIDKALEASHVLRAMPAIQESWMRRWLQGWLS